MNKRENQSETVSGDQNADAEQAAGGNNVKRKQFDFRANLLQEAPAGEPSTKRSAAQRVAAQQQPVPETSAAADKQQAAVQALYDDAEHWHNVEIEQRAELERVKQQCMCARTEDFPS